MWLTDDRYRRVYTPLALSDDDADSDGTGGEVVDDDDDDDDDPWSTVVVATDANGCFNPQVELQEMPEQYYSKDSTGGTCVWAPAHRTHTHAHARTRTHTHAHARTRTHTRTRKHASMHARTLCPSSLLLLCSFCGE